MADQLNQLPPDLQVDFDAVKRRQALADALLQQGLGPSPQGRMVGRFYVPASPFESAAQAVSAGVGAYMGKQNDKAYKAIGEKYNQGLSEAMDRYNKTRTGTPEVPATIATDELGQPSPPAMAAQPGDPQKAIRDAMFSNYGPVRRVGELDLQHMNRQEDLKLQQDALAQRQRADNEAKADRQQNQLQSRLDFLTTQLTTPDINKDRHNATLLEIAKLRRDMAVLSADRKSAGKQMPAAAAKLQDETLDKIGTASSITADMGQVLQQLNDKSLNLGLFRNLYNQARNYAGWSTPEGQKLASFKAQLEKLRNDSLRLNKGVQTEGDSERAWNELVSNINDQNVVRNRLAEIQRINERGVQLHKLGLDTLRNTYGLSPIDTSSFENVPGAMGGTSGAPTPTPTAPNPAPQSRTFGAPPPGAVTRLP